VDWSSSASEEVEVSTRSALMSAASSGGKVIYITADIDMTDTGSGTMLPSVNYDSVPSTLDDFVNTKTSGAYTTYAAWKKAYGKVSTSVNDKSKNDASSSYYDTMRTLNQAYANIITVKADKNTTIIGVPDSDGNAPVIKGGRFSVSSNVVIRNLVLQDACDPFTHHEVNDGFNAQFDCIAVSGANHIWIDHCTFEDTKKLVYAANGEKWQVYDGLCDITNTSSYVTVSNCIFRNHDKTSLIGNGKSDIYGGKITLACNRFYGCGQRLPLLCYPEMHIYNNYYGDESGFYSNSYAIGARYGAYTIIAEGNYFGSGISNAFNASTNAAGICCAAGNSTNSGTLSTTSSRPFEIPYAYVLLPYSSAKTYVTQTAGAGILSVSK
jgi:pectate lyase